MVLSEEKKREYVRRLLLSRLRLLSANGFYGLLLMHMSFGLDEKCSTAYTDGKRICFSPDFLNELSDSELDFVMMHEILHVALQHCIRTGDRDHERFNIACDIVVNSNILRSCNMNTAAITLKKYGESMHKTPSGKEGADFSAEEVYEMLDSSPSPVPAFISALLGDGDGEGNGNDKNGKGKEGSGGKGRGKGLWDDHSRWEEGTDEEDEELRDLWVKRFTDACSAISIRDPSNTRGLLPLGAERLFKELKKPQTDWRTILNDFVQEDICDYSFSPPDRRFDGGDFFLPDFNEKDEKVEKILFMIDTSGSMSDDMITAAYSEVKGAIDQFGGKLEGWLGFFDGAVVEPKPFKSEEDFLMIKAAGGGGTDFGIIFKYVSEFMTDDLPVSIIILTDGYAPFPKEKSAMGIPVLWLLNNREVEPPWGKIARIEV